MFFKKDGFFKKKPYPTDEAFNVALKAGGAIQNKALGYLQSEIDATVAKYCRQYHVDDVKQVLQETMIEMFVQIGNGKYPPEGNMFYSPVAFATKIGYFKTLEASRPEKLSIITDSEEALLRIADDPQLTDWEKVDKFVNHLNTYMKGICADLIWKIKAEKRSYSEIHPDYPQYTESGGLRNQVSKCWNKWQELLKKDGLIKKTSRDER